MKRGVSSAAWPCATAFIVLSACCLGSFSLRAAPGAAPVIVLWTKGVVDFSPARSGNWYSANTNQVLYPGDQLRTGERSRAALRLGDLSILPVGEMTTLRLQDRGRRASLFLLRGILSFFHRDHPSELEVEARGVSAIVRGTEFVFAVDPTGKATVTLYDGALELANPWGRLLLQSGQSASVHPGEEPRRTAVLLSDDRTAIQWALYYPAILDLADLGWLAAPEPALEGSFDRYREGDIPRAMAAYPKGRMPASAEEKLFLAALLLSVGSLEESERWLDEVGPGAGPSRLAAALREVAAAVNRRSCLPTSIPPSERLATEWMAASYCLQSQGKLAEALGAAQHAAQRAPKFGFAWSRQAELEFSFGRIQSARKLLERARTLTPRNAEALSLQGFLSAAENRIPEAATLFDEALAVDGALGNAWLGRGLCRIRQGDLAGGRTDLETAASMEPQRAQLRSYLGKAFHDEWQVGKAAHEFELAQASDPNDPTVWLYRSLLERDSNRVNDSIRSLSQAVALAGERALYRSRLLLDQDRAVASGNQAISYRDAGLSHVSVQTAARALAFDYANASAHQFLADSYTSGDRIELRYETPRVSEYLAANILAPVGGGILSASLSQQEYSKLFERNRLGVFSQTGYLSRGAWNQSGGVHGTFGDSSFLAEAFYDVDPGFQANNDLEQQAFDVQFKQQLGPQDSFYTQALYSDLSAGDLAHYYDPGQLDRDLRWEERLEPIFLAGWHRYWSPQSHTLLLGCFLEGSQLIRDPTHPALALENSAAPGIPAVVPFRIAQESSADTTIASIEGQQIWQNASHTAVAGFRFQKGEFLATYQHGANDAYNPLVLPPTSARCRPEMQRVQVYAYETWRIVPQVRLTAGLSCDLLDYPLNYQYAPVTSAEESTTQLSPKIGFLWEIRPLFYLRGAWTRSLGGVSFEQSFRLEPTQVAGFNQTFRSLIPESVAGSSAAPEIETFDLAWEMQANSNLWVSLSGERLNSDVDRQIGVYSGDPSYGLVPASARELLAYRETAGQLNVSYLLGGDWSLAAQYRLSVSSLDDELVEARQIFQNEALLHNASLAVHFNHSSGFFASCEARWLHQTNRGDSPFASEDLWQYNLAGGYRFARRRAELTVGLLNLTDQDYHLNPLSPHPPAERERTLFARLKWHF